MKLTTLIENSSADPALTAEHGLSLYIETQNHKILFDMGKTAAFAANARAMGIDLSAVDFAVLSHGHYDHGGGLAEFLRLNPKAPVYIHETAFADHYNGTNKYIGLDPSLKHETPLIFTKGSVQIAPGILLTDCNDLGWKSDSFGLKRRAGNVFLPDAFSHEQYLLITEGEKRILISGCSHKGILNIAEHFRPDVLIGGFHLSKMEDLDALQGIARRLLSVNTRYYTGHCTGSKQFAAMKAVMGDRLQSISTGTNTEL